MPGSRTDETHLHETKIHGTKTAPYSVYHGNIPEWIVSFPLHWHEEFELIYCAKGRIQVTVWGQGYTLCEQDLLVVLPHAVHAIEQWGKESGDYYNIMFHPSIFRWSEADPGYESLVLPFLTGERTMDCLHTADTAFNAAAAPCIRSILEHRREIYGTHALLMRANLFLLLHYMNQYGTEAGEESGAQLLSYSRLKNALYYVQHHYDSEITVGSAAGQCGFSESHFMKLFRELTGMSFNAYLVNYRLELAAKQLAETNHKVIDIAESCGFHNPSYFARVFGKKYKMTPLAYRRTAEEARGGEDSMGERRKIFR